VILAKDDAKGLISRHATRKSTQLTILSEHLVASPRGRLNINQLHLHSLSAECFVFTRLAVDCALTRHRWRNRIFELPFRARQSALLNATRVVVVERRFELCAALIYYRRQPRRGCEKSRCIIILLLRQQPQQLSHLRRRAHAGRWLDKQRQEKEKERERESERVSSVLLLGREMDGDVPTILNIIPRIN